MEWIIGYGHDFVGISSEPNIALEKHGWMSAKERPELDVTYAFDGSTTSEYASQRYGVGSAWLAVNLERTVSIYRVVVKTFIAKNIGECRNHILVLVCLKNMFNWGLWYQKQLSWAWISDYIPLYFVGYHYLCIHWVPPPGTTILNCHGWSTMSCV